MGLALDAAHSLGLESLKLYSCPPVPEAAPALARLLSSTTLTTLSFRLGRFDWPAWGFDAAAAALLAPALRTNRTLRFLELVNIRLWDDSDAAVVMLGALTGHVSLRSLNLSENDFETEAAREAAGAAFGALVAANAPALERLDLSDCNLRDAGVGPLAAALPLNAHLRELSLHNACLSGVASRQLLAALRANTSLRRFNASDVDLQDYTEPFPEFDESERLLSEGTEFVDDRERARATAEVAAAAASA